MWPCDLFSSPLRYHLLLLCFSHTSLLSVPLGFQVHYHLIALVLTVQLCLESFLPKSSSLSPQKGLSWPPIKKKNKKKTPFSFWSLLHSSAGADSAPPGDTRQCLQVLLVVMTEKALLVFNNQGCAKHPTTNNYLAQYISRAKVAKLYLACHLVSFSLRNLAFFEAISFTHSFSGFTYLPI